MTPAPLDRPTKTRPARYVVTLVRESEPGIIDDSNLTLWPHLPIYPGLTRRTMTVQYDQGKWRQENDWDIAPPEGYTSLARFTTEPLPSVSLSDGHYIWTTDPTVQIITRSALSSAGTWPASMSFTHRFINRSTEAILQSNFHCTPGRLLGQTQLAGRPVCVIEFGEDRCPRRGRWAQYSRLLDGRVIFWLDTDTLFILREDQYAYGSPEHLIVSTSVTKIAYDPPLESSLFEVTVLPGFRLVETG